MYKKVVLNWARNSVVAAVSAVSLFTTTLQAASSAKVAWDASASPNITAYTVRHGTSSGSYPNSQNAGTALTATVTNLTAGVRYYFIVTARNSSGLESDPSNEISYTPSGSSPANVPPTLDSISNRTFSEDAGPQTVSLTGISAGGGATQILTLTASSSNPGLIPNPGVTYTSPNATGSLLLTPAANANGTAIITVTVNDGGLSNNVVSRSFTVTVSSVNDTPTLNTLGNLTVPSSAGQQTVALSGISSGSANETQTLTVTAASSNTALISTPTVTYTSPNATGSLRFTPVSGATGTAAITVTVNDGQSQNNILTRTFNVTVSNTANSAPTLNALGNLNISEDAGTQTINLSGITAGGAGETQTLTVTATSSNPALVPNPTVTYTSPGSTGTLLFTPVANVNGTATITVTVNDGQSQNNTVTRSFVVTVNAVNDVPTLNTLGNLSLPAGAGQQTVSLSGIGSGAANESQALTVTAASSNTALIPTPAVTYSSPNSTGSLRFTPVSGATGTATLTVNVNDGQASTSRSFTVTVASSTSITLYREAESGTRVSPMAVSTSTTAANGQFVSSPRNNLGTVSFSFSIPQAGTYWVWCRVRSPSSARDSFFVAADNGTEEIFDTAPGGYLNAWQWSKLNGRTTGGVRSFNWNAGTHSLVFRARESYTDFDALYITSDGQFNPAGGQGGGQQIALSDETPDESYNPPPFLKDADFPTVQGSGTEIVTAPVVTDLSIAHLDARTATLTWKTDKPATCLINYRGSEGNDWLTADVDLSADPATNHVISVSSLEPGPTYFMSVVAADYAGGIGATEPGPITIPTISLLAWEAEAGHLIAPMAVQVDAKAVNRACISSDIDGAGMALYSIEVPITSDYRLWCRVRTSSKDLSSIGISLSAVSEKVVELEERSQWVWVQPHSQPFQLESGLENVFIRTIRAGILVDELVLSNDPLWKPGETQ